MFTDNIGLVLHIITFGRVVAHVDIGPQHHQPLGIMHGGVVSTLVEEVTLRGANYDLESDTKVPLTVSIRTELVQQHTTGRLDLVADRIHVDVDQQLWEVQLARGGQLIALGSARVMVVERGRVASLNVSTSEA